MRIVIVGATGAVGRELGRVLRQRGLPFDECRLLASPRSAGRQIEWAGRPARIEALDADALSGANLVFFCAGAQISRRFVPVARQAGALVIDNSSAFRGDPRVPLVVPEVNGSAIQHHEGLIANPNCTTIILTIPLWALHRHNPIRRVVVSTYQAVSGAGVAAMAELREQTRAVLDGLPPTPEAFAAPCAFNVFSHDSPVGANGANVEESKVVAETRRILDAPHMALAVTCMRVPVMRAHLESVAVEFAEPIDERDARQWLEQMPSVRVVDDRGRGHFPTALDASGSDEILVGRIRHDPSVPDGRGLLFICSGDQLRKGAALNAVQIAELALGRAAMPARGDNA